MLKALARFLLTVVFSLTLPVLAYAQDTDDGSGTIAKQAILIDAETGMVMFEKNADEKMPTSSMSKVMTMYVVFDALKTGRLSLDTELPVSEKAWRMGGSKMFVEVGKNVKVEDLIQGVVVQSGNDATVVLAEGLAGTEDAFANMLNVKANELGMDNSHFANASGWPDPDHYSTARDLATLTRHVIADFPQYYPYFGEVEFTYNNIRQPNRNPLLYRNIGADGVKTGHTEIGGYGLIGSAKNDKRRTIMVLNGMPDDKTRAQEGSRLLEWGMKTFENYRLYRAGDMVAQAPVVLGKAPMVSMFIENDLVVTMPYAVKNDLKVQVVYDAPLKAPVRQGTKIGMLHVEVPRMQTFDVPLLAGEDVAPAGLLAATMTKAKLLLGGGTHTQ